MLFGRPPWENLTPLLFCLFINDLEQFLIDNSCRSVMLQDVNIPLCLSFILPLYADDTVLFADPAPELPSTLDSFSKYCKIGKLEVNFSKGRVLIFGRGLRIRNPAWRKHVCQKVSV